MRHITVRTHRHTCLEAACCAASESSGGASCRRACRSTKRDLICWTMHSWWAGLDSLTAWSLFSGCTQAHSSSSGGGGSSSGGGGSGGGDSGDGTSRSNQAHHAAHLQCQLKPLDGHLALRLQPAQQWQRRRERSEEAFQVARVSFPAQLADLPFHPLATHILTRHRAPAAPYQPLHTSCCNPPMPFQLLLTIGSLTRPGRRSSGR